MQITLTLTLEETNQILLALGQRPFVEVAALIQKVQSQATPQANPPESQKVVQ